jgi:hypothetical protein
MNRLTESTWKSIRQEYQTTKTTCRVLAEKYGVNRETVSNRCKLEKWRHGRLERKKRRSRSGNQLVGSQEAVDLRAFSDRVVREAGVWLDRIQEAYAKELRYDRIEAIQKLLPQWKNAVEQIQKRVEQAPAKNPSLRLDVAFLSNRTLPPLLKPIDLHSESTPALLRENSDHLKSTKEV